MVSTTGVNLDKFFEAVESIKEELQEIDKIHQRLHESNELSKTLYNASAIKDLRSCMDFHINSAVKRANLIKLKLESLDCANAANRFHPGCGLDNSTDRTRTFVVAGLRKKLANAMEKFSALRHLISSEYKDTVERRYLTS